VRITTCDIPCALPSMAPSVFLSKMELVPYFSISAMTHLGHELIPRKTLCSLEMACDFLPEFHGKRHVRTLADVRRATAFRQCLTLVSLFACLLACLNRREISRFISDLKESTRAWSRNASNTPWRRQTREILRVQARECSSWEAQVLEMPPAVVGLVHKLALASGFARASSDGSPAGGLSRT
jgi:hypothetical protein